MFHLYTLIWRMTSEKNVCPALRRKVISLNILYIWWCSVIIVFYLFTKKYQQSFRYHTSLTEIIYRYTNNKHMNDHLSLLTQTCLNAQVRIAEKTYILFNSTLKFLQENNYRKILLKSDRCVRSIQNVNSIFLLCCCNYFLWLNIHSN